MNIDESEENKTQPDVIAGDKVHMAQQVTKEKSIERKLRSDGLDKKVYYLPLSFLKLIFSICSITYLDCVNNVGKLKLLTILINSSSVKST